MGGGDSRRRDVLRVAICEAMRLTSWWGWLENNVNGHHGAKDTRNLSGMLRQFLLPWASLWRVGWQGNHGAFYLESGEANFPVVDLSRVDSVFHHFLRRKLTRI